MRRRIAIILLFPFLALIFVVGWVLYVAGDRRKSNNAAPTRKMYYADPEKDLTACDAEVEMGLIEETVEEHSRLTRDSRKKFENYKLIVSLNYFDSFKETGLR